MRVNKHARSRSTLHRLARLNSGIGWNDGGAAGGGSADDKPADKKDDAKGDKAPSDTVTLTAAELEAKISNAKAEAKRESDTKAAKAKAEADEEEARKKGEFEKLANDEKAKREATEAKLATVERDRKLDKALTRHATKQDGYPFDVFEKYVLPTLAGAIAPDASDDAIDKATKEAVETYVKDNPREVKGSAGAPAGAQRQSGRAVQGATKLPANNERPARRFSTLNYRVG